ncbi:NF-kappa-B inhibitor-interacting Ras-like protein isoform X1 [Scaptodrosophila lebanonensis]|uniref:NF-kappa-B inhibitor-interacting Ras-like protein isoform X1 n=1 Tax=Drosophila lebanonensis TaxID=7225 RepID=A0A6J2TY10_DROLE|nr:NF-kappa-B inhibitor-interacting Ras-like protein isoform X1 [Scaptodrosophila lebanonensis]
MLTAKIGKVVKILVCGMKGVGKTALIEQLVYGNINAETELHATIEDIYSSSVDTGRGGCRETIRIYDIAGLQGEQALPRHYLNFPDAFVMVYDPIDPRSLDMLADIKMDIDKHKEKKEVPVIVLANVHARCKFNSNTPGLNPVEIILDRANIWCQRERIKHYTVNAMERPSLYEPFLVLCARLHPPQTKSTFPQLRVMQSRQKSEA